MKQRASEDVPYLQLWRSGRRSLKIEKANSLNLVLDASPSRYEIETAR